MCDLLREKQQWLAARDCIGLLPHLNMDHVWSGGCDPIQIQIPAIGSQRLSRTQRPPHHEPPAFSRPSGTEARPNRDPRRPIVTRRALLGQSIFSRCTRSVPDRALQAGRQQDHLERGSGRCRGREPAHDDQQANRQRPGIRGCCRRQNGTDQKVICSLDHGPGDNS